MAVQIIENRYIHLDDLRTVLQSKFGAGNFKILVAQGIRMIHREGLTVSGPPPTIADASPHNSCKMDDLKRSIEDVRFNHCNFEDRHFIPEAALFRIMSKSAIEASLKSLDVPVHEIPDLTNDIHRGARKCFAILILVGCGKKISALFRRDLLQRSQPDSRLPYNPQALERIFEEKESSPTIRSFIEKQWEFSIPTLHQNMISRELDKPIILPFLREERVGRGSMGTAWKIEVHPQCHKLPLKDNMVIRKQIECGRDDDITVFRRELENLSLLAHLKHPNIVQLFCSYSHRKRYNLIFAVAEGGSLADYLNVNGHTGVLEGSQLLLALADLASAIDAVHNFTSKVMDLSLSGCHHDLAPRNILIHGETLLLADFGLSTFKNADQDSLTAFKEVRGSHIAPESQTLQGGHINTGKISRPSDIWSFGCILSEVLTHMVLGAAGVEQFREKRRVEVMPGLEWFRFHKGPEASNPKVLDWLKTLRASEERFRPRLVDLILKMLSMDPSKRPRSADVLIELRGISVLSLADPLNRCLDSQYSTCPSIGLLLDRMRFQSWLFAFEQILDPSSATETDTPTFSFHEIVEALKEMSRILEGDEESKTSVKQQRHSLLRYQQAKLLESLPTHYQSIAKSRLIELVLQRDDVEQLGGLSAAISEAGDQDVGVLVALKHLTALAEAGRLLEQEDLFINQKDITLKEDIDAHSLALLAPASQRVLVEWLKYKETWADTKTGTELRNRLTSVVGLLRAESTSQIPGSLHCIGVFHGPSNRALGVVYNLPRPDAQPVTLHRLLSAEKGRYRPLLDHRFRLASDICECIYTFHKVGWLHRNLHSMNVLFFPPKNAENTEWARDPRVVGFAGGRENHLDAFTHGPDENPNLRHSQHPRYFLRQERYKEEFDYYSVGILLLEIGLWSTLSKIMDSGRFKDMSPEDVRKKLIATRVPQLGVAMGKRYMEATRVCLEGEFSGDGPDACYTAFKDRVLNQIPKIA
ncbi:kinase domain-containing [Fusarium albosuccineum]|uniref:Kinase domain-containing n=1 Tax=Fusarium albosuccineum TaxID=1237068 RepID=A0A8H4KZC7_9HYPO|nr:kinase domain-containing [Fusarium albosuccineum]